MRLSTLNKIIQLPEFCEIAVRPSVIDSNLRIFCSSDNTPVFFIIYFNKKGETDYESYIKDGIKFIIHGDIDGLRHHFYNYISKPQNNAEMYNYVVCDNEICMSISYSPENRKEVEKILNQLNEHNLHYERFKR